MRGPAAYTADAVQGALTSRWLGRPLVWLDVVGSTNDEARRLADEGAPEGTLVVSRTQSAGRGRQGRAWQSPLGGVWFSFILRPSQPPTPLLSLACAAAVCAAIEAVAHRPARIKWPNDVVLPPELRKAGGLLLEGRLSGSEQGGSIIVGIGIDAFVDVFELSPEVRDIATSVSDEDIRADLLVATVGELERRYDELRRGDLAAVRAEITDRCVTLGRQVVVEWESGRVEGTAGGLDPDGGLVVRTGTGKTQTVWSCTSCTLLP